MIPRKGSPGGSRPPQKQKYKDITDRLLRLKTRLQNREIAVYDYAGAVAGALKQCVASTRVHETQPFPEVPSPSRVEAEDGLGSNLAGVLAMVMERVNTRLMAVEALSFESKAVVDALKEEMVNLRNEKEEDERKLEKIRERLQFEGAEETEKEAQDGLCNYRPSHEEGDAPEPKTKKTESFPPRDAPLGETNKPMVDDTTCKLTPNPFENFSFSSYIRGELKKGVYPETEEKKYATQEGKVKGLFYTPIELEKFMLYGLLHCFDCFLYLFTLLPARVCIAFFTAMRNIRRDGRRLSASQWLDLIRFFIILPTISFFFYLDTSVFNSSVLYHLIRTQTFVKLYFLYNMIDICDRLFSSVGQDLFDAIIYYVAVQKTAKYSTYAFVVYAASLLVQALHCALTMLQYTILLVAFNSHNKVLLVLMLSNNFGELKSTVFKRFSSNNLFQMSCADVRERFQYILLLVLVIMRVTEAYEWRTEKLNIVVQDAVMILLIEVLIDWIKQSFITKFNDISYQVYAEYSRSLAYDLLHLGPGQKREHFDHICRRMGLTPIPMACIFTSVVLKTVPWRVHHIVILFPVLVVLKTICHLLLLYQSYSKVHTFEMQQHSTCRAAHSSSEAHPRTPGRRLHRRTRSQFDLPLRRDRFDSRLHSETSTLLDASYRNSDSDSETPAQLLGCPNVEGQDDAGVCDPDCPGSVLVQAKRSKSLSEVQVGVGNLIEDEGGCGQDGDFELRCRARTSSNHTEVEGEGEGITRLVGGTDGEGMMGTGASSSPTGSEQNPHSPIPLSDVDRYSMCSSQIV